MKSRNEHIITEDEFKTLDTESISQILLKNGKVLKLKSNNEMNSNNNNLKTCTCHKKSKIRNFIIKNNN